MEFRNLKKQYILLKREIDIAINEVLSQSNFISGNQVKQLEQKLADYVGVTYCVSCANGTDALKLALMCWEIGPGDAVFIPDFTFFSTAEVVASCGATPIFVDVYQDTYNMNIESLKEAIIRVKGTNTLVPKVIIPVDLFGQTANFNEIRTVAKENNLYILEDGAQGFGGQIGQKKACSFGDISTTSFFPAKPLGCYGDGGAIFTNNKKWAEVIQSYCIHGKGDCKYDNVRIGVNSRLDTLQAAVLLVKLKAFVEYELENVNMIADIYTNKLQNCVTIPKIQDGFYSSWAQYVIQLDTEEMRDRIQKELKMYDIPTMVYYPKPLHEQTVFQNTEQFVGLNNSSKLSKTVLALPMGPYLSVEECHYVISCLKSIL